MTIKTAKILRAIGVFMAVVGLGIAAYILASLQLSLEPLGSTVGLASLGITFVGTFLSYWTTDWLRDRYRPYIVAEQDLYDDVIEPYSRLTGLLAQDQTEETAEEIQVILNSVWAYAYGHKFDKQPLLYAFMDKRTLIYSPDGPERFNELVGKLIAERKEALSLLKERIESVN